MGVTTGLVLVAGGLLLAARLLLRAPKNKGGLGQDEPKVLSTRGTWIPNFYGTRKTSQVLVGWVGDRFIRKERVAGGGKGSSSRPKTNVFFESVWHIIAIGTPGTKLHEIRFNGDVIWRGPISAANTPSGSLVSAGQNGQFRIYWGETTQPVDPVLGTRMGVQSRQPGLTYVVWRPMRLGGSPNHPQVEYVMEFACEGTTLANSPLVLDDETSRGLNPAHVIHSILTNQNFAGAGLDLSEVDGTSLEALGQLCNTEHLPFNIEVSSGPEAARPLQGILQDLGCSMPIVDGRLSFVPARFQASSEIITLGNDVVVPPDLSREIERFPESRPNPVFVIDNEAGFNYRERDVPYSDDGENSQIGLATAERIKSENITNLEVAATVFNRRWQESALSADIDVSVLRDARLLSPGQVFIRPDFGRVRIVTTTWNADSPETQFGLIMDSYSFPTIDDPISQGFVPPAAPVIAPDLAFRAVQLPAGQQTLNTPQVVILRARANQTVLGSSIWASANASSYTEVGSQDSPASGGTLQEALSDTRTLVDGAIQTGPKFEPLNDDIEDVLDLSGDEPSWKGGRQIMLINDEVFFVRFFDIASEAAWEASNSYSLNEYIEPTTPNGFRYVCTQSGFSGATEPNWSTTLGEEVTDGFAKWEVRRKAFIPRQMIPEQYGTTAETHASGSTALIADAETLELISNAVLFTNTAEVCFKSQPFTASQSVALSEVLPDCITISDP